MSLLRVQAQETELAKKPADGGFFSSAKTSLNICTS